MLKVSPLRLLTILFGPRFLSRKKKLIVFSRLSFFVLSYSKPFFSSFLFSILFSQKSTISLCIANTLSLSRSYLISSCKRRSEFRVLSQWQRTYCWSCRCNLQGLWNRLSVCILVFVIEEVHLFFRLSSIVRIESRGSLCVVVH